MTKVEVPIENIKVSSFKVPTDFPESDGTAAWESTTVVVTEATGGGRKGLGFSYADHATAVIVDSLLSKVVEGRDAMAVSRLWTDMNIAIRNHGRPGVVSMALSAMDIALWDLKARLLDLPLVVLLGRARDNIPVYGSGGFTSYPVGRLQEQLAAWVAGGISQVKMKIGSHPEDDLDRVAAAREAIGSSAELFVDANGAYGRKQALSMAEQFLPLGVTWFEEPVSSDDLAGLRLIRDRGPAGMNIAAGEYGYEPVYFRRMLEAGAVDVLQADASRCGGVTGFLGVAGVCDAFGLPLSAHTAPSIHTHLCCAAPRACNLEYFHDHVRIEGMLFDGVVKPAGGRLYPDLSRPGLGLELKKQDAKRFAI
jgi:L-alanine-DL-glutamate epimerase-like enolase superfamily enzyme